MYDRRKAALLILIPFFFSCGNGGDKVLKEASLSDSTIVVSDSLHNTTKPQMVRRTITENELAAFYVLENKYAGSPDSATLNKWIDPFLDSISINGYQLNSSLFSNGGGPNGAQWNPSADILVIAFLKNKPDTGSVIFHANDFPLQTGFCGVEKMNGSDSYMCWFILPQRTLNIMRHPATKQEIDAICLKRNMKASEWVNNGCSVVRLRVSAKDHGAALQVEDHLLLAY